MFGWKTRRPVKVARKYVAAVNARDVQGVASLLADECRYVDSRGDWIDGRENVLTATRRFFELEENFRFEDTEMVLHDGDVLIRGSTSADDPRLAQDTLWRARVEDGKIAHWQSFGAGEPVALVRILMPEIAQKAA